MNKFLIFIIVLILFTQTNTQEQTQQQQDPKKILKGIVVFIRHGARAPYIEDYYENQWNGKQRGGLTEVGQQQLINLGQKMRKIYIDKLKVVPPEFNKNQVKVKFAFISRCLVSLLGFLRGLYPDIYDYKEIVSEADLKNPSKELGFSFVFNDYSEFQRDLLFRANDQKNCKLIKHIQDKKLNSKKFIAIFHYFRDHPLMESILDKLLKYRIEQDPTTKNQKIELKSMFHIKEIYDSYLMNYKHGKPVPAWNEQEIHLLQMQYEHFFFRFFGFNDAKMIEASEFFRQLNEITDILYTKPDNEQKMFIYSGTKTNIAIFISSLLTKEQIQQLGDKKIAPLSYYVAFEFWLDEETNEPEIRIKYGEDTLELEQCRKKTSCTFKEFKVVIKTRIYKNLASICDIDTHQ